MATDVSSITSHFPSAENGFSTTTSGSVASGATSVGLNSVAGYANGEIVVFIIDPTDSDKKQTFTGTIDTAGVQVTGVVWTSGTNQTHSSGATVVDYADATHISMVSKGILVHADQDGTLKAGAVDNAAVLASNVVTTAKILDDNVTTAKLADASVTAAKRTGGFKVGSMGAVFGSTGNQSVTGLGFSPKLVRFTLGRNSSADTFYGVGAMDSAGNQFYAAGVHDASANDGGTDSNTDGCIACTDLTGGTLDMKAQYVSMDADGFTINVVEGATNITSVYYEAYA